MIHYTSNRDIREILIKIDKSLEEIEVKGNGVQLLFLSRGALKEIFDSLKIIDTPKEKEE